MPVYKSSQEWLRQSALLLEARPETTRITTKYAISPAPSPSSKSQSSKSPAEQTSAKVSKKGPRATLELKTYDPVSGATLKYHTTKAAEVNRLVMSLAELGRHMAGLPKEVESATAGGAEGQGGGAAEGEASGTAGERAKTEVKEPPKGGGGKKKKKGKK